MREILLRGEYIPCTSQALQVLTKDLTVDGNLSLKSHYHNDTNYNNQIFTFSMGFLSLSVQLC